MIKHALKSMELVLKIDQLFQVWIRYIPQIPKIFNVISFSWHKFIRFLFLFRSNIVAFESRFKFLFSTSYIMTIKLQNYGGSTLLSAYHL